MRVCKWCGKRFVEKRWDQEYCTRECRDERSRIVRRKSLYGALPMDMIASNEEQKRTKEENMQLHKQLLQAQSQIKLLHERLQRVESENTELWRKIKSGAVTLPCDKPEPKAPLVANNYCERLRLRQVSPLPCGLHLQCFRPTRCPNFKGTGTDASKKGHARRSRPDVYVPSTNKELA